MRLFRIVVPLLLAGMLPCVAQSVPQKQSLQSTQAVPQMMLLQGQRHPVQLFQGQISPCILQIAPGSAVPSPALKKKLCATLKEQERTAMKRYMAEKNSACYSIRDYQFEIPKGSETPTLKSYSTCVPAAQFEARNVVLPGAVQPASPKR